LGIVLKWELKLGLGVSRDWDEEVGTGAKDWWLADGRIRYSHDCWFSCLGAVKAVPDSFSVYRPSGAFCGEFAATGKAPETASLLREA
jgi:hypothetical protein